MKNLVFQALAEAARDREPVALGIISGVKGSSPQKVGAKALFYADGRIKGTLGGGCLEAEIQQRAVQALRTGESATFDLLLDHDFGWDDGLICGGKVLGLILPNAERAGEEFWKELAKREKEIAWGVGTDFSIRRVRAGEAKSQNPNPQIPKKFQTDKSQTQHHGEVFSAGPNRGDFSIGYLNPQTDEGDEEQDEAGADFRYLETVTPPSLLWIAGAGHIAQAVAPLAAQLDFEVTVFDDRPALASRAYFPDEQTRLRADAWETLLSIDLPPTRPSFALIVTRGHRHDALVLKDWIRKPFLFIGMIGSARKSRTIFEHFLEEKIATNGDLKRVACPVGIKIRSQSVPEIAVSIMAQFIDKRAELLEAMRAAPAGKLQLV